MKNAIKREPCKLVCRWPIVSILCNKKTIIIALLALIMAPVGVEAKKKVKTVEVPQLVNYPSAEVSEYRLHGGEVFIRGRIVANDPQIIKSMEGRIMAKHVETCPCVLEGSELNIFFSLDFFFFPHTDLYCLLIII